jgi:hypothetical protein
VFFWYMFWISGGGNEKLKKKSKALAMTAWVQDSRAQDLPGPCSCSSATPVLVLYCKSIFIPLQPQSSRLHANTSFGPFSPAGQGRPACTLQKPESGDARSPGRNPSSNEEPAVASGTQGVTSNALSASTTAWTAFPFRLIFRPHLHIVHRKIFHPSLP